MMTKLFLFNRDFIELDAASDPRLDPSFPLTQDQYAVLTIEGLLHLLKEEFRNNPQLLQTNARMLRALCALLNQIGSINCVRMTSSDKGGASQIGVVAETTLAQLKQLQIAGQLSEEQTDELVWSKMPAA
jgi:hypothetical protein